MSVCTRSNVWSFPACTEQQYKENERRLQLVSQNVSFFFDQNNKKNGQPRPNSPWATVMEAQTLKWFRRPLEVTNTYVMMVTEGELSRTAPGPQVNNPPI